MPVILFATCNQWKARLFKPAFEDYGFEMKTLQDLSIKNDPPEENGLTAIENAQLKARYFHSPAYPWVFGDDAGLEIDGLNGEPGLQARRWNGIFPDDVDDQTWLDYLLVRMKNIPPEKRTACFVSGWALIAPDEKEYVREVRWPFQIATKPIRPISKGSPISAVRLGPEDDLRHRQEQIRGEWKNWGILEQNSSYDIFREH